MFVTRFPVTVGVMMLLPVPMSATCRDADESEPLKNVFV